MNKFVVAFACLVAVVSARPSGWHGYDDGQWHGDGGWDGDDGQWHGDGGWDGGWGGWGGHGGHADAVVTAGATIVGPSAHGGAWAGHDLGAGYGWGHGHGVVIRGPPTVPAVVAGPSGKIVAHGLYGPGPWGHGHGGHW